MEFMSVSFPFVTYFPVIPVLLFLKHLDTVSKFGYDDPATLRKH